MEKNKKIFVFFPNHQYHQKLGILAVTVILKSRERKSKQFEGVSQMGKGHLRRHVVVNRGSSAALALLAILILVVIVAGVQWWMKSHKPDPDTAENLPVWKEWRLREESEKPAAKMREEQPKLIKALEYDANVELPGTGEARGEVGMAISAEGQVFGNWHGNYYNSKKANCDIQGGAFEGKVFPGKIYRDEKGEDLSKLYFLARGKFMMHETEFGKGQYHIHAGDIYVRGWLSPDMGVSSEITITSDEKYSETFKWQVSRPVKN